MKTFTFALFSTLLSATTTFAAEGYYCNHFEAERSVETYRNQIDFDSIPADQMKSGGSIDSSLMSYLTTNGGQLMKDAVGTVLIVVPLETLPYGAEHKYVVSAKIQIKTTKTPLASSAYYIHATPEDFERTEWVTCDLIK
jgi:hypothetical protein